MTDPVTGGEMAAICRKEWGPGWKSPAARFLGFARRTIYAWSKQPDEPIHKAAAEKVRQLAAQQQPTEGERP